MNINNAAELLSELSVQDWREISPLVRVFQTSAGQMCAFVETPGELHFLTGANLDEGSQEAPITEKSQLWYALNESQNESYRDFFFQSLLKKYEVGAIQFEFETRPYESGPSTTFLTNCALAGMKYFYYINRDDSDYCTTLASSVNMTQADADELYAYFPPTTPSLT